MRTVDPEIWFKTFKKPSINVTRSMKYGQRTISGVEFRIRASFGDAMQELRRNCFKRRWKHICDESISNFERYFDSDKYAYAFVLMTTVWSGVLVVSYNWYQWSSQPPLVVSLHSSQHSVQRVPFPAVALCANNIITNSMLNNYIKFLEAKDINSSYTEEQIRRNLFSFGALVDMASAPVDVMFMKFIISNDPGFNVTQFMFKVAPQCPTLLKRCSWRGRVTPCERLFASRITPLGFCCVFNSQYQAEDFDTPPKTLDLVGQDHGLSVVITENDDDTAYVRRASVGVEMLLFDGTEYPLLESGAVRMYPLKRNASVFLSLEVSAQSADNGLQYYTDSWRGCHLRQPHETRSEATSYAWCLTECRRETAAALCSCAPYTLPQREDGVADCTLSNLECLNKHREKFLYYYPGKSYSAALGEEQQDAQVCLHCWPDCARRRHAATLAHVAYHFSEPVFHNFFSKGLSLVNTTVFRLFYDTEDQKLFVVEVNVRWFEAFVSIASQWIVMMGMTILVICEAVFHCTIRWRHHYLRRTRSTIH